MFFVDLSGGLKIDFKFYSDIGLRYEVTASKKGLEWCLGVCQMVNECSTAVTILTMSRNFFISFSG